MDFVFVGILFMLLGLSIVFFWRPIAVARFRLNRIDFDEHTLRRLRPFELLLGAVLVLYGGYMVLRGLRVL